MFISQQKSPESSYKVYEYNNHYVEAQVWDDAPARPYVGENHWQRCR